MKQKLTNSFLLVYFIIAGCSNDGKIKMTDCTNEKNGENCTEKYVTMNKVDENVKEAFVVFTEFIKWYNLNVKNLNQDGLVRYSDSCGYYIINKAHVYFYINSFKNTNFVSENFINILKDEFDSFENYLKEEKLDLESDGMIGFEADLIYKEQDVDYNIDLSQIKLDEIKIFKDKLEIITDNPFFFVNFSKSNKGKWLIDSL